MKCWIEIPAQDVKGKKSPMPSERPVPAPFAHARRVHVHLSYLHRHFRCIPVAGSQRPGVSAALGLNSTYPSTSRTPISKDEERASTEESIVAEDAWLLGGFVVRTPTIDLAAFDRETGKASLPVLDPSVSRLAYWRWCFVMAA